MERVRRKLKFPSHYLPSKKHVLQTWKRKKGFAKFYFLLAFHIHGCLREVTWRNITVHVGVPKNVLPIKHLSRHQNTKTYVLASAMCFLCRSCIRLADQAHIFSAHGPPPRFVCPPPSVWFLATRMHPRVFALNLGVSWVCHYKCSYVWFQWCRIKNLLNISTTASHCQQWFGHLCPL